mgnify:CR=1 FL=1
MLVIKDKRALVMKLNDPDRVLSVIPTARKTLFHGTTLVGLPHRLDEVRVLRNLGINAPSPIEYHYKWAGRYQPFDHQKHTASFLTLNNKALVLNEIGTGKTQAALWAADYLMQIGQVKKCLIISPLSTLERVWGDAIFMDFMHRKSVTLHGTAERRRKLLKVNADFFIINHDGFGIIFDHIKDMFDLIIVDEAAVLRNPSTDRFKYINRFMKLNPSTRLWLMTGTPTPNDPTDAWSLAKLIESPYCTGTFGAFRDQVMMRVGQWKYLPRPDSANTVRHILQPSVRFTRDECFDLPDTIIQTRKVPLTPEQDKHYKQMWKSLVTEVAVGRLSLGQISAANEAVKLMKLVQIACGVAYGDNGQEIEIDASPRVNVVKEIIEEAGGKVIVFVPLTGALNMLERELSKYFTVAVVNGAVSSGKRNQIFNDFQNASDPRVLIAHPATMAHGLTLTTANTIVWYGPINSNEQYTQANGRIERIGKSKTSLVVHIEATEIEKRAYARLSNKQKLQGILLDMIKEDMEI